MAFIKCVLDSTAPTNDKRAEGGRFMGVTKAAFLTHPGSTYTPPVSIMAFGSTITVAFALLSLAGTLWSGETTPLPLLLAAISLLLLLWLPASFIPLYNAWLSTTKLCGQAAIVLIWFLYILPSGIIMQARGRDPLHLRFEATSRTYWKVPPTSTNMQKLS